MSSHSIWPRSPTGALTAHGLLHSDLHPGNCLWTMPAPDCVQLRVCDAGLVCELDEAERTAVRTLARCLTLARKGASDAGFELMHAIFTPAERFCDALAAHCTGVVAQMSAPGGSVLSWARLVANIVREHDVALRPELNALRLGFLGLEASLSVCCVAARAAAACELDAALQRTHTL